MSLNIDVLMHSEAFHQASPSSQRYSFKVSKKAVREMESFIMALVERKMGCICEHIVHCDPKRKTILGDDVVWVFGRKEE